MPGGLRQNKAVPPFILQYWSLRHQPLIFSLTVHKSSMGCVLGQLDESGKKERAIYYLSKKFTEYEKGYSSLEKKGCALVWVAQRLMLYIICCITPLG